MSDIPQTAFIIKPAASGGFFVAAMSSPFLEHQVMFAGSLTDCLKFIAEQYSPPMIAQGRHKPAQLVS